MLIVNFDAENGDVVPDNKAIEYARQHVAHSKTNAEHQCTIGSALLLMAFQILIVRKELDHSRIKIGAGGQLFAVNALGTPQCGYLPGELTREKFLMELFGAKTKTNI